MDGGFCGLRPAELAMARDVKRWVVSALVACGVIAIAFLPPRGRVAPARVRLFALPDPTPARLRAQALAGQWRSVDGAARLLDQRARIRQSLPHRAARRWGPTVVLTGADSIPSSALPLVTTTMDSVWAKLGLEETKIRVVVVIELTPSAPAGSGSAPTQEGQVYLEPDSSDRTTCVALVPAGRYWTRVILGEPIQARWRTQFGRWLQAGLGPCAFYARYGAPSKPVRRWLAARTWDVALFMDAADESRAGWSSANLLGDPRFGWYWEQIYSYPPATVACMAGRAAGCRAAVLRGTAEGGGPPESLPRVVRVERRWWQARDLVPVERYLSDVALAVGRDRFLRFWSSPLPVDTALAVALKQPVGEWTVEWQRGYTPQLRLGAAAPLVASLLALVLAALAVTSVALTASRRQVR
jgi:hypothetical protein